MRVDVTDFERRYRADEDPWRFGTSLYEQFRYDSIVEAVGGRTYERAFEPGCSVGVLTARLASIAEHVVAVDASPAAIGVASKRVAALGNVDLHVGTLPEWWPAGDFDLLVFSELGYYWDIPGLDDLLSRLAGLLRPGRRAGRRALARLVAGSPPVGPRRARTTSSPIRTVDATRGVGATVTRRRACLGRPVRDRAVGHSVTGDLQAGVAELPDELPVPGGGRTTARFTALWDVASSDPSLGRLAEAHYDGAAILREAGHRPAPGARFGVWAAAGPDPATLTRDGHRFRLRGAKHWCSGASIVSHALLTACFEGSNALVLVDMRQGGVRLCRTDLVVAGVRRRGHPHRRIRRRADRERRCRRNERLVSPPSWVLARRGGRRRLLGRQRAGTGRSSTPGLAVRRPRDRPSRGDRRGALGHACGDHDRSRARSTRPPTRAPMTGDAAPYASATSSTPSSPTSPPERYAPSVPRRWRTGRTCTACWPKPTSIGVSATPNETSPSSGASPPRRITTIHRTRPSDRRQCMSDVGTRRPR